MRWICFWKSGFIWECGHIRQDLSIIPRIVIHHISFGNDPFKSSFLRTISSGSLLHALCMSCKQKYLTTHEHLHCAAISCTWMLLLAMHYFVIGPFIWGTKCSWMKYGKGYSLCTQLLTLKKSSIYMGNEDVFQVANQDDLLWFFIRTNFIGWFFYHWSLMAENRQIQFIISIISSLHAVRRETRYLPMGNAKIPQHFSMNIFGFFSFRDNTFQLHMTKVLRQLCECCMWMCVSSHWVCVKKILPLTS